MPREPAESITSSPTMNCSMPTAALVASRAKSKKSGRLSGRPLALGAPTEIYLNEDVHYKDGCPAQELLIVL